MALKPGCQMYSTDICVPVSQLPALVKETKEDMKQSGLFATCLGHGKHHIQIPLHLACRVTIEPLANQHYLKPLIAVFISGVSWDHCLR